MTLPSAESDARLAAIKDLLDEATGYAVPYRKSRFMPIDSAFTNALRAALEGPLVDRPTLLNPEAVGDPSATPVVQLPPGMVAFFERTRCPECGLINQCHEPDCTRVTTPGQEPVE